MEECIICFEETTNFSFYRCAHKVCNQCYPRIKTCPICNTPNETVIVIPTNNIRVEYVVTTYTLIRNIGYCMILTGMCFLSFKLFFYNIK